MLVTNKKKSSNRSSNESISELMRVANVIDMYMLAQRQMLLSIPFRGFFSEDILLEGLNTCLSVAITELEQRLQDRFPDIYNILQDFVRLRRQGQLSNNRAIFNFIAQRAWNYFENVILTEENILHVVQGLGYVKTVVSMSITLAIAVAFPPAAIFLIPPLLNLVGLPMTSWLAEKLGIPAIHEGAEVVVNAINWVINPIGNAASKLMQLLTDEAAELIIDHYEIENDRYKCLVRVVSREVGEIAAIGLTTGITMGIAQCAAPRAQSFPVPRSLPTIGMPALPPAPTTPLPILGSSSLRSTTNLGSLGNFIKPPQSIYSRYIPEQSSSNPIQGFGFAQPNSFLVDRFMNDDSTAFNSTSPRPNVSEVRNISHYQKAELVAQITSRLAKLGIEVSKEIICLYLENLQKLEKLKQLEIKRQKIKLKNEHLEKLANIRYIHEQKAIKEKHLIKLLEIENDILNAMNDLINSNDKIQKHLFDLLVEYFDKTQTQVDLIKTLHTEQQLIIYLETYHKSGDVDLFTAFNSTIEHYPEPVKTELKSLLRKDYQRIAKKDESSYSQTHYKEEKAMFQEMEKRVKEEKGKATPIIEFPDDEESENALVPRKNNNRALKASRSGNSSKSNDRTDAVIQVVNTGLETIGEVVPAGFKYGEAREKTKQVGIQLEAKKTEYRSEERKLENKLKGESDQREHEINVLDRKILAAKAEREAKLKEREIDLKARELELQYEKALSLRDQQIEELKRENARLLKKVKKLEETKEQVKEKSKRYKKEKEEYKAENAKLEKELFVKNIHMTTFGQSSNAQTPTSATNSPDKAAPTSNNYGMGS